MSRDRQISDMARDVEEANRFASRIITEETYAYVNANHRYNSKDDFYKAHSKTANELASEHLYNAGYRKSEEVAREIFAEIDKIREDCTLTVDNMDYFQLKRFEKNIDELKKKYTETTEDE